MFGYCCAMMNYRLLLFLLILPIIAKTKNVRKRPLLDHLSPVAHPLMDKIPLATNWKTPNRVISATYSKHPATGYVKQANLMVNLLPHQTQIDMVASESLSNAKTASEYVTKALNMRHQLGNKIPHSTFVKYDVYQNEKPQHLLQTQVENPPKYPTPRSSKAYRHEYEPRKHRPGRHHSFDDDDHFSSHSHSKPYSTDFTHSKPDEHAYHHRPHSPRTHSPEFLKHIQESVLKYMKEKEIEEKYGKGAEIRDPIPSEGMKPYKTYVRHGVSASDQFDFEKFLKQKENEDKLAKMPKIRPTLPHEVVKSTYPRLASPSEQMDTGSIYNEMKHKTKGYAESLDSYGTEYKAHSTNPFKTNEEYKPPFKIVEEYKPHFTSSLKALDDYKQYSPGSFKPMEEYKPHPTISYRYPSKSSYSTMMPYTVEPYPEHTHSEVSEIKTPNIDLTFRSRARPKPIDLSALEVGQSWTHGGSTYEHGKDYSEFDQSQSPSYASKPKLHLNSQSFRELNSMSQLKTKMPTYPDDYLPSAPSAHSNTKVKDHSANVGASISVGKQVEHDEEAIKEIQDQYKGPIHVINGIPISNPFKINMDTLRQMFHTTSDNQISDDPNTWRPYNSPSASSHNHYGIAPETKDEYTPSKLPSADSFEDIYPVKYTKEEAFKIANSWDQLVNSDGNKNNRHKGHKGNTGNSSGYNGSSHDMFSSSSSNKPKKIPKINTGTTTSIRIKGGKIKVKKIKSIVNHGGKTSRDLDTELRPPPFRK